MKVDIVPYIKEICKYMKDEMGLKITPLPKLIISKDKSFVNDVFGKTAYYMPENKSITLYTEGRHPKDVLRSFCHELVHHAQNLRGDLDENDNDPQYAQNNKHLRKMECEAYLKGNIALRDWEDSKKNKDGSNT